MRKYVSEDALAELKIRESGSSSGKPAGKQIVRRSPAAAKRNPQVGQVRKVRAKPAGSSRRVESLAASSAAKRGVPAFRIMSDRVLLAIAEREPKTAAELLAIPGVGIKLVEKYGAQIYRILDESRSL